MNQQPNTKTPIVRTPADVGQRNNVVLAQQCLKDALTADNDADMNDAVNAARYWLNY